MGQRAVALGLQLLWVPVRGAALSLVALRAKVLGCEKVFELGEYLVCHWMCQRTIPLGLLLLCRRGSLLLAAQRAKVQGYEKVSELVVDCLICHWTC